MFCADIVMKEVKYYLKKLKKADQAVNRNEQAKGTRV